MPDIFDNIIRQVFGGDKRISCIGQIDYSSVENEVMNG